jgi:hypothetical protein
LLLCLLLLLYLLLLLLLRLLMLLLSLLLLLNVLLLLSLLLLLDRGGHGLSALFLLHELLHLGMCRRRMRVLELWDRGRSGRRSGCHLLGGLGIVEGRVGHVSIVVRRRRCLRRIRLRRREVRTRTADVRSGIGAGEMAGLRRRAALVEGDAAVGHGRRG